MVDENMLEEMKAMVWGAYNDDEIRSYFWEMMGKCGKEEMQQAFSLILRHRKELGGEIGREMIDRLVNDHNRVAEKIKIVVYPQPLKEEYSAQTADGVDRATGINMHEAIGQVIHHGRHRLPVDIEILNRTD